MMGLAFAANLSTARTEKKGTDRKSARPETVDEKLRTNLRGKRIRVVSSG